MSLAAREVSRTIVAISRSVSSSDAPWSRASAQARIPAIGVRSWCAASARNRLAASSDAFASAADLCRAASVEFRVVAIQRCSVTSRAPAATATISPSSSRTGDRRTDIGSRWPLRARRSPS